MDKLKLAMIQMRVAPGDKGRNLAHASELVREAANKGAEVAVLPEACTLGWADEASEAEADAVPGGESCDHFRELARRHKLYLCAGLVERCGKKIFNAAILADPEGCLLLHHRKVHELDFALKLYTAGDRLAVVETRWGRMGVMICADAFAPGQVISRTLGEMGARVVLSPCSWAVPEDHDNAQEPYGQLWRDNYCPVAKQFGMWICGVSNVGWIRTGEWRGRKCIGNSMLVDGRGCVRAVAEHGVEAEQIVIVEVEQARTDGAIH